MKKLFLIMMLILIPAALSIDLQLDCNSPVDQNSDVDCDVVISNAVQGDVTFEFEIQTPNGYVSRADPTPAGALSWNGLNNKVVVFNFAGVQNGVLSTIHLTSGSESGLVTLVNALDGNSNIIDVQGTNVLINQPQADVDTDGDGWNDNSDGCPNDFNPTQGDWDADGIQDACDLDRDGDGVDNVDDNCPQTPNRDQANGDGALDNEGDVCDLDLDNDGVFDIVDNCPNVANPVQEDSDGDGQGDVCEIVSPQVEPQEEVVQDTCFIQGVQGYIGSTQGIDVDNLCLTNSEQPYGDNSFSGVSCLGVYKGIPLVGVSSVRSVFIGYLQSFRGGSVVDQLWADMCPGYDLSPYIPSPGSPMQISNNAENLELVKGCIDYAIANKNTAFFSFLDLSCVDSSFEEEVVPPVEVPVFEPEVVDLDLDNDGVNNDIDECPDTVKNKDNPIRVNLANGCPLGDFNKDGCISQTDLPALKSMLKSSLRANRPLISLNGIIFAMFRNSQFLRCE